MKIWYLCAADSEQPLFMTDLRFVYPEFLYALLLLAIPVIVHLFNFRRFKKIAFTNVRYLKEITEETSSRSKLKHLLTLLTRLLVIAFLVFAFAQPYIPVLNSNITEGGSAVSIYVDNSFSMEASTREGTSLDIARDKAKQIVQAFKPTDKFQILTNDFDPAHQRFYTQDEIIGLIDIVAISPSSRKIDEILNRQNDAFGTSSKPNKYSYFISDLQKSIFSKGTLDVDSSVKIAFVQIESSLVPNVSIDSVWFSSPVLQKGQPAELNVRLQSFSLPEELETSISLSVNNIQRSVASTIIPEDGSTELNLTFTPEKSGWYEAAVSLDDTPIRFDDEYYFSFYLAEKLNILVVNDQNSSKYLAAMYADKEFFDFKETEYLNLDFSNLDQQHVIILNQLKGFSSGLNSELDKYINDGGSLVIIPDSASSIDEFTSLLSRLDLETIKTWNSSSDRVGLINENDILFDGVFERNKAIDVNSDLPLVSGKFTLNHRSDVARDDLMDLGSGNPFLVRYPKGEGQVYLFLAPFSESHTNFTRHALFVPVMFRLATTSLKTNPLSNTVGANQYIPTNITGYVGDATFNLINEPLNFDIIPAIKRDLNSISIYTADQPKKAGQYQLIGNDSLYSIISYNYNRIESVMEYLNEEELSDYIVDAGIGAFTLYDTQNANITSKINTGVEGFRLWKYCILFVLLFLLAETLLLKFFRT